MNTVDLNGGEFTHDNNYCTPLEQIPLLIDKIGNLLVNLKPELKDGDKKVPFYCFKVISSEKTLLSYILKTLALPKGCSLYECDGNVLFDIRGASGGIVTACCFYLIVK